MNDKTTIFAVSTGSGRAGIAVVRLSGPAAKSVLENLTGSVPPARQAVLRSIRSLDGLELIDRGMVLFFPGPKSATGEDVAEFHVHGSPAVVDRLLVECSRCEGCRYAEAGEFTRRAFVNDRLDLVEVEGLADLLASETEAQRRLAMRQFSGEASSVYVEWHRQLVGALAIIEAAIDFADEDGVAEVAVKSVRPRLAGFEKTLKVALAASEKAALVRRGLRIVIAGTPNVGKSSLLNVLTGRKTAIVSATAGTTRDVIEAALLIDGMPVSLADTAGLRSDSSDLIEQEGMERTRAEVDEADILLWVTSAAESELALPPRQPDLTVINKSDLVEATSILLRNDSEVAMSAKTGAGLHVLQNKLAALIALKAHVGETGIMVRARHRAAIAESIRLLNDAQLKSDDALELMAEDVRKAAASMASITGRVDVEDFLGRIFQEFCVGK
jgi:tRNA modification GTPase